MKIRKNRLKEIIREALMREEAGGAMPSAQNLAAKLSQAGPEAAMVFLQDVMTRLSFATAPAAPEAAPVDPADEEIDIDLDVEDEVG